MILEEKQEEPGRGDELEAARERLRNAGEAFRKADRVCWRYRSGPDAVALAQKREQAYLGWLDAVLMFREARRRHAT